MYQSRFLSNDGGAPKGTVSTSLDWPIIVINLGEDDLNLSSHNLRSFVRGLRFQCGTSRFRLQISPPDAAVTARRSRRDASNALPRDRLNARSSGPPPRILLRRRFPEPPIAPEFRTRRLAPVLHRSASTDRRREVAFRRAIEHTGHAVSSALPRIIPCLHVQERLQGTYP